MTALRTPRTRPPPPMRRTIWILRCGRSVTSTTWSTVWSAPCSSHCCFLTSNTIAQSVRERTAELAVLKTLGFTDAGVQWLVLAEALTLGMVSGGTGSGAGIARTTLDDFRSAAICAGHWRHACAGTGLWRRGGRGTAARVDQRRSAGAARAAAEYRYPALSGR